MLCLFLYYFWPINKKILSYFISNMFRRIPRLFLAPVKLTGKKVWLEVIDKFKHTEDT